MKRTRLITTLAVALMTVGLALVPGIASAHAGIASANHVSHASQTAHTTAQALQPMVSCSGNGCNGQDPAATGCSNGAYTVWTEYFQGGYVELRYSPTCGTNWARTTSTVGTNFVAAQIERQGGLTYNANAISTSVYTDMVYAPTTPAQACGVVGDTGGGPYCTGYH